MQPIITLALLIMEIKNFEEKLIQMTKPEVSKLNIRICWQEQYQQMTNQF